MLPSLVGAELTAELLNGGARLYVRPEEPYIPFEFADAAYRYGHSQIRQRYRVNAAFGPVPVFPDLLGFGPVAAEHAVDWPLLVDVPGRPAAQRAKRIDGRLPASLIALPTQITGELEGSDYASLANRDLERGQRVGLPSGEAVARALGVQPLDSDQVGLAAYGRWRTALREGEPIDGRGHAYTIQSLLSARREAAGLSPAVWAGPRAVRCTKRSSSRNSRSA